MTKSEWAAVAGTMRELRQQYAASANHIRQVKLTTLDEIARAICRMFKMRSSRFSGSRFLSAVGVPRK